MIAYCIFSHNLRPRPVSAFILFLLFMAVGSNGEIPLHSRLQPTGFDPGPAMSEPELAPIYILLRCIHGDGCDV